jgi:hypothetical protein
MVCPNRYGAGKSKKTTIKNASRYLKLVCLLMLHKSVVVKRNQRNWASYLRKLLKRGLPKKQFFLRFSL